MKNKRKLRMVAYVFILILVYALVFPTWTPKIKGDHSISTLNQVEINGTKLTVMIRGENRTNPILIFVHGGPGCSEIPYVRKYQDLLEKKFTVVHYDQHGSGKSYHFFEDYSDLSTKKHVEDLLALTDYISEKFGQEKVLLIGHSFGTYIGMQAASKDPDKFYAYIGIGQVSNNTQSELDSLAYTLHQAEKAGNRKDVHKLEQLRVAIENGEESTPRNLVRKYGGAARQINDNIDYYTGFLFNPEYNLVDVIRYLSGVSLSQNKLIPEEREYDLPSIIDHLEIPCYFVMGKYDYMTSVHAAKAFYKDLDAPKKDFVIFDKSAHYPQFEQEEQFADWLMSTWEEIK